MTPRSSPRSFPIPQLADREPELQTVRDFISDATPDAPRCLIFHCRPASGATFFARTVARTYSKQSLALYHDCTTSQKQIPESILASVASRSLTGATQVLLASEGFKGLLLRLFSRIFPAILPAMAPSGIATLLEDLPAIRVSPFPSVPVETLARTLTGKVWKAKGALVVIDNAQDGLADLRDLLEGLHAQTYYRLRFVLFFVARPSTELTYSDWIKRLRTTSISLVEARFNPPGPHLVRAYGFFKDLSLTRAESARIAEQCDENIFEILDALTVARPTETLGSLYDLSVYVLAALRTCGQALPESDLLTLVATSELIVSKEGELERCIGKLTALGALITTTLEHGDRLIHLSTSSSPIIKSIDDSLPQIMAVAKEAYDYHRRVLQLSSRHSEASVAKILYNLSYLVEPQAAALYAQRIVVLALRQGSLRLAEKYVSTAIKLEPRGVADVYIRVAFYVAAQDYRAAYRCLDAAREREWQQNRMMRLLNAYILNRLRRHRESAVQVKSLLEDHGSLEEAVVLHSIALANLLHEGKYEEAANYFTHISGELREAANYNYFLRNGAAAFLWCRNARIDRAFEVLTAARRNFSLEKDYFGVYTTLSNLGVVRAYMGRHREALESFRVAFDHLAVFGTHHLEEAGFNLAVSLALSGNATEAERRCMQLLEFFGEGDFPRAQLQALYAFLLAIDGRFVESRTQLAAARQSAEQSDLAEARYYAAHNSAVLEGATPTGQGEYLKYIKQARGSGFRPGNVALQELETAVRTGLAGGSGLWRHFSFDYLHYWSQNPFELLAATPLTGQAVGEDML